MDRILTVATARKMEKANIFAGGRSHGWASMSAITVMMGLVKVTHSDGGREREKVHDSAAASGERQQQDRYRAAATETDSNRQTAAPTGEHHRQESSTATAQDAKDNDR